MFLMLMNSLLKLARAVVREGVRINVVMDYRLERMRRGRVRGPGLRRTLIRAPRLGGRKCVLLIDGRGLH